MKLKSLLLLILLNHLFFIDIVAQSLESGKVDVLHYHVYLEPDMEEQHIKGSVQIRFRTPAKTDQVSFDSGELTVTGVEGDHVEGFEQLDDKTMVSLAVRGASVVDIQIFYEGKPTKGMVFLSNLEQLYTVYFTSSWMVCNFSPDDRATIQLDLLVPDQLTCIGSGVLVDTQQRDNDMTLYSWRQDYETPAYTYGFVVGSFHEFHADYGSVQLNYYADNHQPAEIEKIFRYTGDMISFFEGKTGIPLPQNSYAQVLIGNHFQEMSGFAILKANYGKMVLKDSTETNLISHELAHQWWGNMITCKNWNHFWLNEGFATYMSAAYNEHRFGKIKYQQDIDAYFGVYDKIMAAGEDKPLVFKSWSNPTRNDRNLVYFKGAYVLHLLRKELGDEAFWKGVMFFTQRYYGKSVTTEDFQLTMEQSSGKDLKVFFDTWIY
jgi:aminopeptidase N